MRNIFQKTTYPLLEEKIRELNMDMANNYKDNAQDDFTELEKVFEELSKYYNCEYDDRGNIGKRYRRQDEIGTPYCVTYDFDSEEDGMVTVRDRDTMEQERVKIADLKAYFEEKFMF